MGGSSWIEKIKINGKEVKVEIDVGAEINIMSNKMCKAFKLEMEECRLKIEAFGKFKIKSLGKVNVLSENNNEKNQTECTVVEVDTVYVIGFKDARKMGCINNVIIVKELLRQNDKKKKFIEIKKDIFNGRKFFPDEVTVKLCKEAVPKICSREGYPISIQKKN